MGASVLVRRTTPVAAVGTTITPFVTDGTWDLSLPAAVGDVVEVGAAVMWAAAGSYTWLDVGVMVSGSLARYVSSGTTTSTTIFGAFQTLSNDFMPAAGSVPYTVRAGDVVAGNVTFRLYGRTSSGTRALDVGVVPYLWATVLDNPPAISALSGNTGASGVYAVLTGSATVAAAAGDVVEVTVSGVMNPGASASLTAATMVAGAPVNWLDSGTTPNTTGGVGAWRCSLLDYEPITGAILYTVQAADVVAGNVTIRLYGKTAAAARPVDPGSSFTVRKIGPSAMRRRPNAFPAASTTTWGPLAADGTHDLTVAASAGDVIELGLSQLSPSTSAPYMYMDVATMVGGSPTTWASTGTGSHTQGVAAWFTPQHGTFWVSSVGGCILYTVQPGDVVSGAVTFRLYGKTFTGSATWPVAATDLAMFYATARLAANVAFIAVAPPAPVAALAATVTLAPAAGPISATPPAPVAALAAAVVEPSGSPIGVHTVTVGGVDLSCWVESVTINHGRDGATGQPEASSVSMDLTTDATVDPLPPAVDVGAPVVVTTETLGGVSARFVGRVTDVSLGWEDSGPDTPDTGVGQLVAVGMLADLGRRVVGDTPWPMELDGARVARVMAAAGITLDPATSDPGTVQLLPRDVDSADALATAQGAATDAGGVVWATRGGNVRYADADHRRGVLSSLTLDACNLLVTPTWRRNLDGLVNSVSVGYGVAPEGGGEQPRFVEDAPASIARWGEYAYTTATTLAALADATTMGRLLLARNADPVWIMAALPVDTPGLTFTQYEALLALDVHTLVTLTGLPAIGTAPTTANLWVEGYRETLSYGAHEIELVVSGYCWTAPPPRWDDMDAAWTWDDGPPSTLTWDAVACLGGPPVNVGRWNDQPATLRWDQLDPALTWDTYPNEG